ncbi:AGAP000996-PA-like protein [Anopheles sinensis]|uniref:AGAP000996-PA-like protein n=1 Tax=Anopheles sinensis TaxID=74873 RepID=A0A084VGP9_ANOSI|nr:AGAP000996-PA-like protein [Anopheles sinensis]
MYDQMTDGRGYLVYKNRYNGKTEQDNPNLMFILLSINEKYASSRYSTYRCAGKLYALQKALYTSYIPFEMVHSILNRHQLSLIDSAPSIKPPQLTAVLHDVYFAATRMGYFDDLPTPLNLEAASAILAGFFWAVFDPKRSSPISVLELRQTFLLLCSHANHAQMIWEHFRLISDHNLCVSRHRFEAMLTVLSKMLMFLGEPDHLRPAMVQQITSECFLNYPGLVGLTEYQFSCLWKLSSLFSYYANVVSLNKRMQDTEHIVHGLPCYACRTMITGLRFKCQRCRNVSLCIDCFTHGFANKQHNMSHKMFEISSNEQDHPVRCGVWLTKLWHWVWATRYQEEAPSPSTYENMEAKLIDTKAVELMQEGASEPHDTLVKEALLATLSRASTSTVKRNMSLFSSVEYNSFNNTQQKHLLNKLASVTGTLEEHHNEYRKQVTECWNTLSAEEQKSVSKMHSYLTTYSQQFAECLEQLKQISTHSAQALPQCSSTPYRRSALTLVANDCANESSKSKYSPEGQEKRSFVGSSRLEKTELSVRDISTWFHIDLSASGSAPGAAESESKRNDEKVTNAVMKQCDEPSNPSTDENELSYRIDRLKLDTQMANFRDLLLKVREIVDDSYSDNTELARSTLQIEKALDRIIAEEELKRAKQLI